jgi:hypothetical protein
VCDDFESGTAVAPTIWNAGSEHTLAKAAPDTVFAHSGKQALHVHSPALTVGQTSVAEIGELGWPPGDADLWVRLYFYDPTPTPDLRAALVEALPVDSPGPGVAVGVADHAPAVLDGSSRPQATAALARLTVGRWACLVWHVSRRVPNQMEVWVDDQYVPDLHVAKTAPRAGVVRVGFAAYNVSSARGAVDYWIDDVAVSGHALACP